MNRERDKRIIERILAYMPFTPKIEASDVGKAMYYHAIDALRKL